MADTIRDQMRQTLVDVWPFYGDDDGFGLAIHDVYKRVRTWGGPGRGYGGSSDDDIKLEPRPKIQKVNAQLIQTSGGLYSADDIFIEMPGYFDCDGETGGFQLSDFEPPSDKLKELKLLINGDQYQILDGPGTIESYLKIRLHCRREAQ